MDNLFQSIKQQLCSERNIIVHAYDVLSLMNSEFPRELFNKQQGDFIITYYYSRQSRIREFNKATDHLINEIYKYRHYNYLIQNQFDKIMQSISMIRSTKDSFENTDYKISDIKDISVMFKFLELDFFSRNNILRSNIQQKLSQELMSQFTEKLKDNKQSEQENFINTHSTQSKENNILNMNNTQNLELTHNNQLFHSKQNSQNSFDTFNQPNQQQQIIKQENNEEVFKQERKDEKANLDKQYNQQNEIDLKYQEFIKRMNDGGINNKQNDNQRLDLQISDKEIEETIQFNSQRAMEYFNSFKKNWDLEDIQENYFQDCKKNSIFHEFLGKEQIQVIQDYEKTLNQNRKKVKKTIRKQKSIKNSLDLVEINQKNKKLKNDQSKSCSDDSQVKKIFIGNLHHLESNNNQNLNLQKVNSLQVEEQQISFQQQQQNIDQLQTKKRKEKKQKYERNKKNNNTKNLQGKGQQVINKEKESLDQETAKQTVAVDQQLSEKQQIIQDGFIERCEIVQIQNDNLFNDTQIQIFNNEQIDKKIQMNSQRNLNQNDQVQYQTQLNQMRILKQFNTDSNNLDKYDENLSQQSLNQIDDSQQTTNLENIQQHSKLNQQNDYNQLFNQSQNFNQSKLNQFQSTTLDQYSPRRNTLSSNNLEIDAIYPEEINLSQQNQNDQRILDEMEEEKSENKQLQEFTLQIMVQIKQEQASFIDKEQNYLEKQMNQEEQTHFLNQKLNEQTEQIQEDNIKSLNIHKQENQLNFITKQEQINDISQIQQGNKEDQANVKQENSEYNYSQISQFQPEENMAIEKRSQSEVLKLNQEQNTQISQRQENKQQNKIQIHQKFIQINSDDEVVNYKMKQKKQNNEKSQQNQQKMNEQNKYKKQEQNPDNKKSFSNLLSQLNINGQQDEQQFQQVQQLGKKIHKEQFKYTHESEKAQNKQAKLINEMSVEDNTLNLQKHSSKQLNQNNQLDQMLDEKETKLEVQQIEEENQDDNDLLLLIKKAEQINDNKDEQTQKQNIQSDMCLESPSMNDIELSQSSDIEKLSEKQKNQSLKVNINELFVYPICNNPNDQTTSNSQTTKYDNKIESPSSNDKDKKKKAIGKTFKELTQEEIEILKTSDKRNASQLAKQFGMSYQTMRKSILKLQKDM